MSALTAAGRAGGVPTRFMVRADVVVGETDPVFTIVVAVDGQAAIALCDDRAGVVVFLEQ